MTDTYKMELNENQVKWLMQRKHIQGRMEQDVKIINDLEKQNAAMQFLIEKLMDLTGYENTKKLEAEKNRDGLTSFNLTRVDPNIPFSDTSEWYDSTHVYQHIKKHISK